MVDQQADQLMRGKSATVAIHATNTISISVGDETDIVRMLAKKLLGRAVILLDGLGIDAAKERIVFCIQRRDAARRPGEQLLETTGPDTKERVMGKLQFRLGDQFEVHQAFDGGVMLGTDVGQVKTILLGGAGLTRYSGRM